MNPFLVNVRRVAQQHDGMDGIREESFLAWLLMRYGVLAFFGAIGFGYLGSVSFRHEFNAPYTFAWAHVMPVIVAVMAIGAWQVHAVLSRRVGRAKFWAGFVLLVPLMCLMSGGWVGAVNGWAPPRGALELSGVVEKKWRSGEDSSTRILDLRTESGMRSFEVCPDEYEIAIEGQTFTFRGKLGALGLAYAPRCSRGRR